MWTVLQGGTDKVIVNIPFALMRDHSFFHVFMSKVCGSGVLSRVKACLPLLRFGSYVC